MNDYLPLPELPLIAILRGLRPDRALAVGEVLLAEGFSIIEVPLNRPGALECVATLAAAFGRDALIGAGTVLSAEDAGNVVAAGGRLIVSPDTNVDTIRASREAGAWVLPGAATPTEAFTAIRAGASGIKAFPAETIGCAGIRAWRAVLPPGLPIVPVGGVTPESLGGYLAAGAAGFGVGSPLFTPERSLNEIAERAATFRRAYEAAREEA
jgi:2-dehydro-3-deoxyphosphogalactonate aldolase